MSAESGNVALYDRYDAWKGWTDAFRFSRDESAYYRAELGEGSLAGLDVFEIGFGSGAFLAWAREQGARVTGSEITPAAIRAAKEAGVPLLPGDFGADGLPEHAFDLIVAFDVFEHIESTAIAGKLAAIDRALKPGGRLLLRYPNGQSPFGLVHQHGDATHLTALSRAKIEQYAAGTGLVTMRYQGAARVAGTGLPTRLARAVRDGLRDLHSRMINFLYGSDVELAPVVTHLLMNREGEN